MKSKSSEDELVCGELFSRRQSSDKAQRTKEEVVIVYPSYKQVDWYAEIRIIRQNTEDGIKEMQELYRSHVCCRKHGLMIKKALDEIRDEFDVSLFNLVFRDFYKLDEGEQFLYLDLDTGVLHKRGVKVKGSSRSDYNMAQFESENGFEYLEIKYPTMCIQLYLDNTWRHPA